jgi:PKD repeat protein
MVASPRFLLSKQSQLLFFVFCIFISSAFSQESSFIKEDIQECTVERIVNDNALDNVSVEYLFNGFFINEILYEGTNYQTLSIKNFGFTEDVGKPLLPVRYDRIVVPNNATIKLTINKADYIEYTSSKLIFPAFKTLTDEKNDSLIFEIDEDFYAQDKFSPSEIVQIESRGKMHEVSFVRVKILPMQYNPVTKTLRIYTNISYSIDFGKDVEPITALLATDPMMDIVSRTFLNPAHCIPQQANKAYGMDSLDYLIITHDKFLLAADSLSQWKNQLGYSTRIVSKSSWTSQEVNDSIAYYYQNYSPAPDYFVIIGDHDDVPAQDVNAAGTFVTDLYYACMDSVLDYHPDIFRGRISVTNIDQALKVVNKLIMYEKEPITDAVFYNTGLHCAQFQDDEPDGYANRRFTHTCEEARDYLMGLGYKVNRVYATGTMVDPQYYNNGYYSNGQPIPASLLRSNGYQWDGNYQNIVDSINDGRFLVMHRDHGYTGGWGTPNFSTAHLDFLQNKDKYPMVFSLNCSSGRFSEPESFAEKFLRLPKSGAIGVIAASYTSYSGYNDAFAIGLFDAVWSNPGINPVFGTAGNPNPVATPHNDIYEGGRILDYGLIRMTETFGDFEVEYQLFHYHGDPALKLWTQQPTAITATAQDTLNCDDTVLNIYSSSCPDAIATLCVNGIMLGKTSLVGGVGTISFPPVVNWTSNAVLTLSQTNYKPYIKELPIVNCTNAPEAKFTVMNQSLTLCENTTKCIDQSLFVPTSWKWVVSPATCQFVQNTTDTTQHPVIAFNAVGDYTIKLIVENAYGIDSISYVDTVTVVAPLSIGYTQDFEGCDQTMACLLAENWEISSESYQWKIHNDSTPSFYTGPIVDHTLGTNQGMYFYTEASSGSALDTASFIIPCLDLTGAQIPVLSFWYHMYGEDIYKLNIDVYASGQWNNAVHSIEIQQQTDYSDPWKQAMVDLTAFASQNVKIRFTAIRGDSYQGDMAIDDINIMAYNQIPDVAFTAEDLYSCCDFQVQFNDSSCCGITSYQWYFQGGTPATSSMENPVISYASPGTYNVKMIASNVFGTDSVIKTALVNVGQDYNSPLEEDFENFVAGNPGTFMDGWQTYESHDFDWRVNQGGTPSANTGPLNDHTLGNSSGKYVYTESSYVNYGEEAILYSPCLALDTNTTTLSLGFWYHMYGSYIDTLYVEMNKGDGWDLIYYLEGDQQQNQIDPWLKAAVDISSYIAPRIRLRFRSIKGVSYMEDIAVDDVNIDTVPAFRCKTTENHIVFDSLAINDMQIRSFYLKNTGVGTLHIDSILLQAPFHIMTATNFDVLPGDSQLVFVQFYPQNDGVYQDTVILVSSQSICDVVVSGVCDNRLDIKESDNQAIIYPNPAQDKFFIKLNTVANIDVFDLNASLVYRNEGEQSYSINAAAWMPGIYYIRISTKDTILHKRLILIH